MQVLVQFHRAPVLVGRELVGQDVLVTPRTRIAARGSVVIIFNVLVTPARAFVYCIVVSHKRSVKDSNLRRYVPRHVSSVVLSAAQPTLRKAGRYSLSCWRDSASRVPHPGIEPGLPH